MISRYGIMAVDAVAAEIDSWEAQDWAWREGVKRPGALIHSMIRNRSDC